MTSLLSKKQSEYIIKLIKRNAELLEALFSTDDENAARILREGLTKPLHEPMQSWESSIRRRLRKKAQAFVTGLGLIELAGIAPDKKNSKYNSLTEYVNAFTDQMYSELTLLHDNGKKEVIPLWIASKLSGECPGELFKPPFNVPTLNEQTHIQPKNSCNPLNETPPTHAVEKDQTHSQAKAKVETIMRD